MLMGVMVQCTMLTYEKNAHMGVEHWPFVHGTIKTPMATSTYQDFGQQWDFPPLRGR